MVFTNYAMYLGQIFKKAGVDNKPVNREILDKIIREVLSAESPESRWIKRDAQDVWEEVKKRIFINRDLEFESKLVKSLVRKVLLE